MRQTFAIQLAAIVLLFLSCSLCAQPTLGEQNNDAAALEDSSPRDKQASRPKAVLPRKQREQPLEEKTFKNGKEIIQAIPEEILPPMPIRKTNDAYTIIYRDKIANWCRQFSAMRHRASLRVKATDAVGRSSNDPQSPLAIVCRSAEGKLNVTGNRTSFPHAGVQWELEVTLVFQPEQADRIINVKPGSNLAIEGTITSINYAQGPHVVLPDGRGGLFIPLSIVVSDVEIKR